MKAEITKDRVLEAASKCPTAKETLKVLFPEFFVEDKYFQLLPKNQDTNVYRNGDVVISISNNLYPSFELKGKCFLLCCNLDWEIVQSKKGTFLIPTKK